MNETKHDSPINISTIGALIDYDMVLQVHCNTWGCMHSATVDLEALAARIGRDHSHLAPAIKRYFRCTACGGRDVGFIVSPHFNSDPLKNAPTPEAEQTDRPNTTHRRRSRRNLK